MSAVNYVFNLFGYKLFLSRFNNLSITDSFSFQEQTLSMILSICRNAFKTPENKNILMLPKECIKANINPIGTITEVKDRITQWVQISNFKLPSYKQRLRSKITLTQ